jgi:type IV pilus assembly protein PilC
MEMPKFSWEGRTRTGGTQKGVMDAPNAEAVIAKLRSQDIVPVEGKVKEKKGLDFSMEIEIPGLGGKVTDKDLVLFTRQFATMIDAGLPLVQCLEILSTESENRAFRSVLSDVRESVEGGSTFADALAKHPKVFDALFVNMVAAGEVGGILDTILNRLAATIEKSVRLKKQIKGAMIYPLITIVVAILVVVVMMVFVIPMFSKMFIDMGATLPALTQYVVNMSNWMAKQWGWAYVLITAGTIFGIWRAMQVNPKSEMMLHQFYLLLPVLGDLIRKSAVASFTRTLGTMVSSGVPILDGLDITARVAGNRVVEDEIKRVRQAISEGKTMSEPLRESKVFPPMVVQMIGVGEQTGALDAMLQKIADFYEEEVDDAVAALTSMLEPMIMIFLAVVAGGIVISMYLPIFSLAQVFAA